MEICTEIGIDRVIPWPSQRAIAQWKGPKAEKGRQMGGRRAGGRARLAARTCLSLTRWQTAGSWYPKVRLTERPGGLRPSRGGHAVLELPGIRRRRVTDGSRPRALP